MSKNYSFLFLIILIITLFSLVACVKEKNNQNKKTIDSLENSIVNIYSTNDSLTHKLTKINAVKFTDFGQPLETQSCVFVFPDKVHQTFLGIGGAITDASAEVFAKLPFATQEQFLNAYFNEKTGIGYKIIRTNMNSCDFSSASYTYIDHGDKDLKTFDITHDLQFKIPLIKKAMAIAKNANFYFSPWSPPAFMKDNNDMLHGGKLKSEFYDAWANYYVKFIQAYEKEGIPVWGLSIQNEPMAKQIWESCIYTADDERNFLKNNLGPTLEKNNFKDKKIIVWDHNRDLISQRADVILSDPDAAKYVWGVGFHWYEDWSGGKPMFDNVKTVFENFPDKNLIFTEGCVESFDANRYYDWNNAKEYAVSMINDFNNGTVAWTDWNILLDQNGGPNHVKNFCFAPIHADVNTNKLILTPSYFVIGHFSKFIQPGAIRVSSNVSRSSLLSTTFKNPDGSFVTVVLNNSNDKIKFFLSVANKAAEIEILPNAIQTLVY